MNLPLSTNKKEGAKTVRNSSKDATKEQITCPVKKQNIERLIDFPSWNSFTTLQNLLPQQIQNKCKLK